MPPESSSGFFQIGLRGQEEDDYPAISDINYFLNDLNLLYEFCRVMVDPQYREYRFTRFFFYRNKRRIEAKDRLRIERLRQESPLNLITVLEAASGSVAALWVLVQTIEKVANFRLNRAILILNRDKLRRELAKAPSRHLNAPEAENRFTDEMQVREAEQIYDKIVKHLSESPIQIREIEITYFKNLPPKTEEK